MEDLIKALNIFNNALKRNGETRKYPTHCEHDVLFVDCPEDFLTPEEIIELDGLSFFENEGGFSSFRFGSC